MIARASTCVTLSLVIVVVASVVLHRPDRPKTGPVVRSVAGVNGTTRGQNSAAPPGPKASEPAKSTTSVVARRPRTAFDRVREGETFEDVARRIYGDGADLQGFWKVNRDQLASPGAEVRPGMVLRTPVL